RLTSYQLSANQWSLLKDLIDALEIFKEATDLFSQKDVPLIMDVLPIFFDIRLSLTDILMDKKNHICSILKVAAKAALLMVDKYTILTSESEVYYIAIGELFLYFMCPDRKLDWFKERDYDDDRIEEIKDMVVKWWTESYKPNEDEEPYDAEPQVLFILFYSLNNIHV
ncbi:hypothetical protein BDQ17DRAFT_1251992, partial [Cyathus striatus]